MVLPPQNVEPRAGLPVCSVVGDAHGSEKVDRIAIQGNGYRGAAQIESEILELVAGLDKADRQHFVSLASRMLAG